MLVKYGSIVNNIQLRGLRVNKLVVPIDEARIPYPPKGVDNPINKRYLLNEMNKLRLEFTDQEGGFLPIRKWVSEPLPPNVVYTNTSYGEELCAITVRYKKEIYAQVYMTGDGVPDNYIFPAIRDIVTTNDWLFDTMIVVLPPGHGLKVVVTRGEITTRILTSNWGGRELF